MKVKYGIFADWLMSYAKHATKDNRKNPEYHVVVAIRRLRTDKNCPSNVKYEQQIGSKKIRPSKKHMFLDRISIKKRAGGRFFLVIYYFLLHAFFTHYYLPPGIRWSS